MFFLLRSAFWIVAVAFAVQLGFIPNAPPDARDSASQVVAAVANAPDVCQAQPAVCAVAAAGMDFAGAMLRTAGDSLAAEYERRQQNG